VQSWNKDRQTRMNTQTAWWINQLEILSVPVLGLLSEANKISSIIKHQDSVERLLVSASWS